MKEELLIENDADFAIFERYCGLFRRLDDEASVANIGTEVLWHHILIAIQIHAHLYSMVSLLLDFLLSL